MKISLKELKQSTSHRLIRKLFDGDFDKVVFNLVLDEIEKKNFNLKSYAKKIRKGLKNHIFKLIVKSEIRRFFDNDKEFISFLKNDFEDFFNDIYSKNKKTIKDIIFFKYTFSITDKIVPNGRTSFMDIKMGELTFIFSFKAFELDCMSWQRDFRYISLHPLTLKDIEKDLVQLDTRDLDNLYNPPMLRLHNFLSD